MEKISSFLLSERKKRGLTQSEMAEKISVSESQYCTYEKGWVNRTTGYKSVPGLRTAKRIAKFTNVSIEEIVKYIDEERKN